MRVMWILIGLPVALFLSVLPCHAADSAPDPAALIQASFDHYRGKASKADVEMVIHRPTWERSMRMVGWTKGQDKSLIRITAPAKDEGNGTLKKRDRDVDLQPQGQPGNQTAAGDDVAKLDGI